MSLAAAAHVHHNITHTSARFGFIAGAILGAVTVGAAVVFGALTFGLGAVAVLGVAVVAGSLLGELAGEQDTVVKGKIVQGSSNVRVNSKSAAYCTSKVDCDDHSKQQVAQGSGTVLWNTLPAARKGDKGTCGFKIGQGSPNVFVGGPMGGCGLAVGDEVGWGPRAIVNVIGLLGGAAGLWRAGLTLAAQQICGWGIATRLGVGALFGIGGGMGMNWLGGAIFGEGSAGQRLMSIAGMVLPFRLGMRSRFARSMASDPVDVVTGEVVVEQTDFELPGALPLSFGRYYVSGLAFGCHLGPKWANSWGQFVTSDSTYAYLHTDDGRRVPFELPEGAEEVRNPFVDKLRLWRAGGGFAVRDEQRRTLRFETRAAERLLLSSVEDPNGHRIDFAYDGRGALREVVHSGGYRLRVEAEPDAIRRVALVEEDGREQELVRYGYDAAGRLTEVYNSSGLPMRYEYDAAGRLVRWEDRRGTWFSYEYDREGRAVRTRGVEGMYSGSFVYDELNLRTSYTDSLGHTTHYTYNDDLQVVRVEDAGGAVTLREYDERGNLLAETDPNGHATRYEYDGDGNLLRQTDALGTTVSASYDPRGLPEIAVDEGGKAWLREYDGRGNLAAARDGNGVRLRVERDDRGNAVKVTDALGNSREFGYESRGLVVWETDWKGSRTTYRRDAAGRVVERADALGNRTEAEYYAGDKPWRVRLPNGAELRWEYDSEGNLTRFRDADGREHRYEYGRFDLMTSERKPDGTRRRYRYDTEGRLVAVTNEHGAVHSFRLDEVGRVILERDFSGRELRYEYDAAGSLVRQLNASGQAIDVERDALGRVTRKRASDGEETVFEYDAYGGVIAARNSSCVVELERDGYGQIVRETQNGRTVESEYDALGLRLKRRASRGGELGFAYDANAQLLAVSEGGGEAALTFTYDALRREVSRETAGGCRLLRGYDALGRLVELSAHEPAGAARRVGREVAGRRYRYDASGNPLAVDDRLWGAAEYEYNANEQVVRVLRGGRAAESYEYDATGQLTGGGVVRRPRDARREAAPGAAWARDEGGRLHKTGRSEFRYDADGRVVAKTERVEGKGERRWRYEWDAEGRLRQVSTPDGARWRYEYDPFGRRVRKSDGGAGVVEYVWDGDVLAEEIRPAGGDGGAYAEWLFEPESFAPLFKREAGSTYYCQTDQAGTPRELLTSDGAVAWAARHGLWGEAEEFGPREVDCPVRFQGQWYDEESGLHYNRFRYYDPQAGGYLSPDPLGLEAGFNHYAYVHNPLSRIDPFGLAGCFKNTTHFTPSTGRTYKVFQRNDINWDQVRTGGHKDFIGRTNAEAARAGVRPQLADGSFVTLHHSQQSARGPWFEASTRYHHIANAQRAPLHPYGRQQHPHYPLGRGPGSLRDEFQKIEGPEYWRWREQNR